MTFVSRFACVASFLALAVLCTGLAAAERAVPAEIETVEMFSAIEKGQIEVKLFPNDSKLCNVVVENKTEKPLTVKLPEAFAGMPVLAQLGGLGGGMGGMGGGGGTGGYGGGGGGGQSFGGGMGGYGGGMGGGGMGGMGGMGGGGFMNVPAEKVGKFKVTTVCLEHGKPEPRKAMAYEIRPIDQFTGKKEVHQLCKMLGYKQMPQRVAQAAAWNLSDDMSWQELASKQIKHANGMRTPYFSPMEIRAAMNVTHAAIKTVKEQEEKRYSESESLSQN